MCLLYELVALHEGERLALDHRVEHVLGRGFGGVVNTTIVSRRQALLQVGEPAVG